MSNLVVYCFYHDRYEDKSFEKRKLCVKVKDKVFKVYGESTWKVSKSNLYTGFIYLNFKLKDESVYDVQIDYKDLQAKDLAKRIDCAIASFLSSKNLS